VLLLRDANLSPEVFVLFSFDERLLVAEWSNIFVRLGSLLVVNDATRLTLLGGCDSVVSVICANVMFASGSALAFPAMEVAPTVLGGLSTSNDETPPIDPRVLEICSIEAFGLTARQGGIT
jgi:hypothetical protein